VVRTILDLAAVSDPAVEAAIGEAERRSLFGATGIEEILARSVGRRGARRLRRALDAFMIETAWTRTELERRFLALCIEAGLPRPRVNAWIPLPAGGVEADFSWPEQRLIVETDGRESHDRADAFERDRHRDQQLVAAGWRVVRFTWHQVVRKPDYVVSMLHRLFAPKRTSLAPR
jgi:hypothetical protein